MAARPLHWAHERIIRQSLEDCDLLVIFLTKPYMEDFLSFELRKKVLKYFVKNFLPKEKIQNWVLIWFSLYYFFREYYMIEIIKI